MPLIAEVFGGLAPQGARFLVQLACTAAKFTTKDNTKYTRATRSFLTHHGRRISHAIVITGAQSIMNEILKLKKSALTARPAQ